MRPYRQAVEIDPTNCCLRLRLGLFLKDRGLWADALGQFTAAVDKEKTYADGWRERGIAENKLFIRNRRPEGAPTGESSLEQAAALNAQDYDAWASLGGVLKREADFLDKNGNPTEAVAQCSGCDVTVHAQTGFNTKSTKYSL